MTANNVEELKELLQLTGLTVPNIGSQLNDIASNYSDSHEGERVICSSLQNATM